MSEPSAYRLVHDYRDYRVIVAETHSASELAVYVENYCCCGQPPCLVFERFGLNWSLIPLASSYQ